MRNAQRIIASGMIILIASMSVRSAESDLDTKSAKLFKVTWSSVGYSKQVTVQNPDASSSTQPPPTRQQAHESLSLSGRIEVQDPNRILGTCSQGVIIQMVDGGGRDVNVAPPVSVSQVNGRPLQMRSRSLPPRYYEVPRYSPQYTQPPQPSRWESFIRSMLKLPSPTVNFRPQLVDRLQPTSLNLNLDLGLLQQAGGEVRRVKGYFYAAIPESTETRDVPFEPNNTWVQLTPDLEIQVLEATCLVPTFQYSIQTRGSGRLPTISGSSSLNLPSGGMSDRVVSAVRFVGADGKLMARVSGGGSSGSYGANSGKMSASGGNLTADVKFFRFTIAVKPTEHKIPFEFEHIPLPKP